MPQLVNALKDVTIVSAAAGDYTSLALARNGELWSWGKGPALGHGGDDESQELLPKVIQGLPPGASILRIADGGGKATCALADGATLCWGEFSNKPGTSTPTLLG